MIDYNQSWSLDWTQVLDLYQEAQWSNYTHEPDKLYQAYQQSLLVIAAWKQDELVGIVRVVGDGLTILYIQDLLVKKVYRRQGIGQTLLQQVNLIYPDVRQKVLLTDSENETISFYKQCGYFPSEKVHCTACVQLK